MKYLAGCQTDYQELAALLQHDPSFPRSEEDWLRILASAEEEAVAEGLPHLDLSVEVGALRDWCQVVGIVPCLDALRAYLIVRRAQLGSPSQQFASTTTQHSAG